MPEETVTKSPLRRRQSETHFVQPELSRSDNDSWRQGPAGTPQDGAQCRLDLQFAARLVEGCEQAWQEFVTRYAGLVRSRVACVVGTTGGNSDGSLIEDLVAEVFAALLNNDSAALKAYAGRSSLATYLCVIASRVAIRKVVAISPTASVPDMLECADPRCPNPAELASGDEQAALLRRLIDELPERQRQIVSLYYLQGRSYEQISQQLGVPIGSVGPTLKRAQEKLRNAIDHPR